jgi:tRNA (guanine37-N1)-methyltransferase
VDIHVISIFPEMFASPLGASIPQRAQQKRRLEIVLWNLRDFTTDRHHVVDDAPYGGGQGMVMKVEPIVAALEAVSAGLAAPWRVLLSPQGRLLRHGVVAELAARDTLVLLCGRYEGVDERVRAFVDDEISIGDYVLSGGELPAMVLIDAVARVLPGVLGNAASPCEESFADGLLEHPHYTRPEDFRGLRVPAVLLSGDHGAIAAWRRREALRRTADRRPDLLTGAVLTDEERALVGAVRRG